MSGALTWLAPESLSPVTQAQTQEPGAPGARYDGLLHRTPGGVLAAADLLAAPEGRAAVLRPVVPAGAALARGTAVWVHTGSVQPQRPELVVEPRRRVHSSAVVHRQHLWAGDVAPVGGVPTTTPLRTAVDLLCFVEPGRALAGLRALLRDGLRLDAVRLALDAPAGRLPVRRARGLLEELGGAAGGWCP